MTMFITILENKCVKLRGVRGQRLWCVADIYLEGGSLHSGIVAHDVPDTWLIRRRNIQLSSLSISAVSYVHLQDLLKCICALWRIKQLYGFYIFKGVFYLEGGAIHSGIVAHDVPDSWGMRKAKYSVLTPASQLHWNIQPPLFIEISQSHRNKHQHYLLNNDIPRLTHLAVLFEFP